MAEPLADAFVEIRGRLDQFLKALNKDLPEAVRKMGGVDVPLNIGGRGQKKLTDALKATVKDAEKELSKSAGVPLKVNTSTIKRDIVKGLQLVADEQKRLAAAGNLTDAIVGTKGLGPINRIKALIPALGQFSKAHANVGDQLIRNVRIGGSFSAALTRMGIPIGHTGRSLAGLGVAAFRSKDIIKEIIPVVKGVGSSFGGLAGLVNRLPGPLRFLAEKFTGVRVNAGGMEGALGKVSGAAGAARGAVAGLASKIPLLTGVLLAVGAAIGAFVIGLKSIKAAEEAETSNAQLEQSIRNMGLAVEPTLSQFKKLNERLALNSGISEKSAAAAESILTMYGSISAQQVSELIPALEASARLIGGTLPDKAEALAAALEDPLRATEQLVGIGVRFTQEEKEKIKTMVAVGRVTAAQDVIIKKFMDTFQGRLKASEGTLAGIKKTIGSAFGVFARQIGDQLLPGVKDLFSGFKELAIGIAPVVKFIGLPTWAIFRSGMSLLGKVLEVVGKRFQFVFAPLNAIAKATNLFGGKIQGASDKLSDHKKKLDDAQKGADALKEAQEAVAQAGDRYKQSLIGQERALASQTRAQEDLAEQQKITAAILNGFPASTNKISGSLDGLISDYQATADAVQNLPEAMQEAQEAFQDYIQATISSQQAALAIEQAQLDHTEAVRENEDALKDLNNILHGYAADSEEAIDATDKLVDAQERHDDLLLKIKKDTLSLQRSQLEYARNQRLINLVTSAYGDQSIYAKVAQNLLAESQLEVDEATQKQEKNQRDLQRSQRDLIKTQQEAQNILHGYIATSDEAKDAQERYDRSVLQVKSSEISLTSARLDAIVSADNLRDAHDKLSNTLNGYPPNSDRAREAVRSLRDMELDSRSAALDYASSQNEITRAMSDLAKAEQKVRDIEKALAEDREKAAKKQEKEDKKNEGEGWFQKFVTGPLGDAVAWLMQKLTKAIWSSIRIPGFASGGQMSANQWGVVGEKGPELFLPNTSGRIAPTGEFVAMLQAAFADLLKGIPTSSASRDSGRPIVVPLVLDGKVVARTIVPHLRAIQRERS